MDELKKEIKEVIISSLELEDIKAENIEDDAPLFNEGLGLDSIDALELGVALKKKFNVKFAADGFKGSICVCKCTCRIHQCKQGMRVNRISAFEDFILI